MGLAALGALLFVLLALIGQSPRLMRRLGLDVYRLDLRVRAFTGYAFACLLLIGGFFIAGVPLGEAEFEPVAEAGDGTGLDGEPAATGELPGIGNGETLTTTLPANGAMPLATQTEERPATGAMGGGAMSGVPTRAGDTVTATVAALATPGSGDNGNGGGEVVTPNIPTPTIDGGTALTGTVAATATGTPTPVSTDTPTPTPTNSPTPTPSNTPTITPSPTPTPTPTQTPTPIVGETAVLDTDGANVWLLRSPGGQQMELIGHGTIVILLDRHANQGGVLWREIMTVQGVSGWVQAAYLEEGT